MGSLGITGVLPQKFLKTLLLTADLSESMMITVGRIVSIPGIDLILGVNVDTTSSEKVDSEQLRLAMRQWTTGVTVVTSELNSFRHGMTVSSFTSVSLEPPLVLVSIERVVRTHQMICKSGIFGVSILAEGQDKISDRFAGRESEAEDRFAGLETFTLETGAPLLLEALSNFDCKVLDQHDAGSHTLFIGLVVAVRLGDAGKPLIYYDRDYRRLVE